MPETEGGPSDPRGEPTPLRPAGITTKPVLRKRVYKTVSVIEDGGTFGVSLDGRALKTPGRADLITPSRPLAEAVAAEWDAQAEHIDPATMPLAKLLNTCIDRIAPNRDGVVADLVKYVEADMLCYRADAPETLVARQHTVWQPVLDWLEATHGIALACGSGLMPLTQDNAVTASMSRMLASRTDPSLTAVQAAASMTGSLALAAALADRHLSGAETFAAAQLDETWQLEQWGEDADAVKRRQGLEEDLIAVERFVDLSDD